MQQKQKPRSRGSVINHRLYSSIFSLIVNIVTLLFHHAIYLVYTRPQLSFRSSSTVARSMSLTRTFSSATQQQGWKVIERFQGILQHFQEIGVRGTTYVGSERM